MSPLELRIVNARALPRRQAVDAADTRVRVPRQRAYTRSTLVQGAMCQMRRQSVFVEDNGASPMMVI